MSVVAYVFPILAALFTLVLVIWMLRRGRLRERHAIWWIVGGTLALVVSVFPVTLTWATAVLGFNLGTNLVYFVSIALLVLVCIQHSSELTKIESQMRTLAEELALAKLADERRRASDSRPSTGPAGTGPADD
jgi:hypothetical protein